MISESEIIRKLQIAFPEYIGDDAAIINNPLNKKMLITTDILVEDIHFRRKYYDPESLAHKLLHVNMSDIVAMGGETSYILLGGALPPNTSAYIKQFMESFLQIAKTHNIILIGGDTTSSVDKLFLSVTAIGYAEENHIKTRYNAKDGDIICLAGNIGESKIGLHAFENNLDGFEYYKNIHLKPKAKIDEGKWLGTKSEITSMMDLSDGLFLDLNKLINASKAGCNIDLNSISMTNDFISTCTELGMNPIETAITGGEDFALLFTVKQDKLKDLAQEFQEEFEYKLNPIGEICNGNKMKFLKNNKEITLNLKPYTHFGEDS